MQVAIHVFQGITAFHLATPLLVFGEARRQFPNDGWDALLWSTTPSSGVRTDEGLTIGNLHGPSALEGASMLVFPSWPHDLREPSNDLLAMVREAHSRGTIIVGLCLGAFPVMASGILNGRSAATHWAETETLARNHPDVIVDADPIYIDHGDVLTSAGTASALDACVHVIRKYSGAAKAAAVARHLVIAPYRDGGQAQFIERDLPTPTAGAIGETVTWALANLNTPLTVDKLSALARMSTRNFSRQFRQLMGVTPARWVLARRLNEACRLLESTQWSIERVAHACGFGSVVTFRQQFIAHYSTTPSQYRRHFTETS